MSALSKELTRGVARVLFHHLEKRRSKASSLPRKAKHDRGFWLLEGDWVLMRENTASALMKIAVTSNWMMSPPLVRCAAPFMNRTIDWHCSDKGDLCYVHPVEWFEEHRKNLTSFEKTADAAIKRSAFWIIDAVDDLLHKHFLGWESGCMKWPDEWLQWKHGDEGIRQYFDEKSDSI